MKIFFEHGYHTLAKFCRHEIQNANTQNQPMQSKIFANCNIPFTEKRVDLPDRDKFYRHTLIT